jgi:hypothetical protein
VARDATARLYDVDADSFAFEKRHQSEKYDVGTISFRARPGKRIDLQQLHESIWATRLSGGTNSGVISLEVTAIGEVAIDKDQTLLKVAGTDRQFILVDEIDAKPPDAKASAYAKLLEAIGRGEQVNRVTGYVDGWSGRWPAVLRKTPARTPRLMVTEFQTEGARSEIKK